MKIKSAEDLLAPRIPPLVSALAIRLVLAWTQPFALAKVTLKRVAFVVGVRWPVCLGNKGQAFRRGQITLAFI